MFEKSPTWQRFSGPPTKVIRVSLGHVPILEPPEAESRTPTRIAIAVAILLHIGFFLMRLPELSGPPEWVGPERPVYAVKQIRFQPPPPTQAVQVPRKMEKRRIIPVPDPTPDDPEPIRVEEIELPESSIDIADLALGLGIPDAPPSSGGAPGPMQVGGEVAPPVRLFGPAPPYTEEARQGRVQGVVILEAIIDALGNVNEVKVLKGLPMGLTEQAIQTAAEWKFEPATRDGRPVPVFFNLTIRFSLQ
jgi:TonB family protein